MAMFLATVFSICFLVGTLSAAPTSPSTSSSATAPILPKNFFRQLEILYRNLQTVCNKDKLERCERVEIQEVKFAKNCTQVFYKNMFCQAHNVLHRTQCGKMVSEVIPSSLRGGQATCGPSDTQDKGIALTDFCFNLNTTVDRMYREC